MINNKQMAQDIFINIADLPQASEITAGDYFIVENAAGTQIINFADIIIPVENTLITPQVIANATTIETLSVSNARSFEAISTNVEKLSTDIIELNKDFTALVNNTNNLGVSADKAKADIDFILTSFSKVNAVVETINSLSKANSQFIEPYSITYGAGESGMLNVVFAKYTGMDDIKTKDIIFAPVNEYAKKYTKYIEAYSIELDSDRYTIKTRAKFKTKNYFQFNKTLLSTTLSSISNDSLNTYTVSSFANNVLSHILSSVSISEDIELDVPEENAEYLMLVLGQIIS